LELFGVCGFRRRAAVDADDPRHRVGV